MATITRYKQDIVVAGSLANGLGGSGQAGSSVGPAGAAGYVFASVTKVVAASTDPNPYVYTVTKDDAFIEVDASSQNVQVVFPNATVSQGRYLMVKRADAAFASANAVTLIDAAGNNVEGAASQSLNANNAIFETRCDASVWQCIGGANSAAWGHIGAIASITPPASGSAYTATAAGFVVVTGGTVTNIQLKRGATTIQIAAATPAVVPVSAGDQVITTYSVAPTMSFVPR
ncbi:MAG: hypothetical protein EPN70_03495 [Paraburkholderia sp.]|uniref:hypothetical protein n=1 Tax=Paraburkholderia sp. TaxID=1926495 RepID=UPI00120C47F2|nr:hypothetical protein [Paraburkholderia sp.]TAM07249.1 MAG: hypothetical protein EPN70_03495 [Paraburkholderia sp.]TAM32612.1 MAG: hypothetical protein EPN59_01565 [Paraburkholderia sp.]